MRTKIIALLICATMVIGVLPVYAFAEDGLSEWTYNVLSEEEKTAEITGYNGTDTELLFPKEINGYTMVAIADNAFKGSSSRYKHFTSVMIPDSYERIGDNNFYYYQDLEDIELPDGLRYIGINSFVATKAYEENYWDCLNRNQIICFYIGEYCIKCEQDQSPNLSTNKYIIRPGTKLIASGAFYWCYDLKGIIIPDGVEYINDSAFCGCHFSSIVVPSTVKGIGSYAFSMRYACYASIPATVQTIADNAFEGIAHKTTIYGAATSEAERVATANNITFVEFKDVVYGDVDGDGVVSVNDYASMKSCVLCEIEYEGENEIIGDMNGDCVIDGFDLFHVDMAINGMA